VVVRADPGRLEQILVNLAVNSRDAMPSGGELRIEVSRVADGAELGRPDISPAALIRVIDNGVGMDEATRSRVFEPFFTTKKPGEGTGLGLATVCSNVELFGGDVRVDSRPGEGTAVSIVLPVADAEPDGVILARLAERRPGPRATVLVAEDDQSVRALVVAILERAGHRVLVAGAPAEAVALADGLTDPIHVLLTDAVMPGGTGRDLATRLRASRPGLKVVLMSGYDIDGSREPEIDHTAFLAKPFSPEALLAAVESFELD